MCDDAAFDRLEQVDSQSLVRLALRVGVDERHGVGRADVVDPLLPTRFEHQPSVERALDQLYDFHPAQVRAEITRVFTRGLREGGEIPASDRSYLAQVVSSRTGMSQPDAEKRVSEVIEQARSAADQARSGAAKLSLWLTAAMLIGAFSASLAAIEGGQLRDGTWKGVIGASKYRSHSAV